MLWFCRSPGGNLGSRLAGCWPSFLSCFCAGDKSAVTKPGNPKHIAAFATKHDRLQAKALASYSVAIELSEE